MKRRVLAVVPARRRGRDIGSVIAGVGGGAVHVEGSACGSRFRVVSAKIVRRVVIAIRRRIRV